MGCEEGVFSIEFAQHGANTVGVEIREANIEKAKFCKDVLKLHNLEFRKDDVRNIGLGPEHDWASHGSDAFRYMAVAVKHGMIGDNSTFSATEGQGYKGHIPEMAIDDDYDPLYNRDGNYY